MTNAIANAIVQPANAKTIDTFLRISVPTRMKLHRHCVSDWGSTKLRGGIGLRACRCFVFRKNVRFCWFLNQQCLRKNWKRLPRAARTGFACTSSSLCYELFAYFT